MIFLSLGNLLKFSGSGPLGKLNLAGAGYMPLVIVGLFANVEHIDLVLLSRIGQLLHQSATVD